MARYWNVNPSVAGICVLYNNRLPAWRSVFNRWRAWPIACSIKPSLPLADKPLNRLNERLIKKHAVENGSRTLVVHGDAPHTQERTVYCIRSLFLHIERQPGLTSQQSTLRMVHLGQTRSRSGAAGHVTGAFKLVVEKQTSAAKYGRARPNVQIERNNKTLGNLPYLMQWSRLSSYSLKCIVYTSKSHVPNGKVNINHIWTLTG